MVSASLYPSASMAPYDISRNDFVNQNYQLLINNGFDMGSEQSLYPSSLNAVQAPGLLRPFPYQLPNNTAYFQPPQIKLAQTFPTNGVIYNGGIAPTPQPYTGLPYLQTAAPSLMSAQSPASSSSTPSPYGLTPSPIPLGKELHKADTKRKSKGKSATRNAAQAAKRGLLIGKQTRRNRGPNRRPAGTAFSNLLEALPEEIKETLDQDYQGCCETINTKDVSTKQKHIFSARHCKNIPQEYQGRIPNFICPAFVAFKSSCKAKAGRYDSAERHTKNCVGFHQINVNRSKNVEPVVITRSQFNSILSFHTTFAHELKDLADGKVLSTEKANYLQAARTLILQDLFTDGLPDWLPDFDHQGESNDLLATMDPTAQLPTDTTSVPPVPVADHVQQPSLSELSLLDLGTTGQCAGALGDVLPQIPEGGFYFSDETLDGTAQPSMSVVVPVENHSERPSNCVSALFNSQNGDDWNAFSDFWQN